MTFGDTLRRGLAAGAVAGPRAGCGIAVPPHGSAWRLDLETDPTTGQHTAGPVPVRATVPLPSRDARRLLVDSVGAGVPA